MRQGKIRAGFSWVIAIIALSFLCLLFSCTVDTAAAQQAVERAVLPERTRKEIRDVEKVRIYTGDGNNFTFYKFTYDSHEYFMSCGDSHLPLHAPSCPCHQETEEKTETSSFLDFNW